MENPNFQVITDIEECKKYWEMFSFKTTLFDLWDFRYCFYKYDNYPLHFIVGFLDSQPIGLLPLQLNTDKGGYLEFFGGNWMEDNKVYIDEKYSGFVEKFFGHITDKAHLIAINSPDSYCSSLPIDEYKYQLDIKNYSSYWDYIQDKYNDKSQDTFRRKFRKIEQNSIEFSENNSEDMDLLIELNIRNFKEDSSFNDEKRKLIYKDFLQLGLEYHLITIKVNGVKQAVSMNIVYNDVFYYLNAGSNFEEVPNLGNYTIMSNIGKAIELKCKKFDALMISYNWKERWHFDKIPFTKFEKPI
jgi:hypothetical protein